MRIVALCGFAWEPKGTVRARAFPMMQELARRGHPVTLLTVPYDNPRLSGVELVREGVMIRAISLDARFSRRMELPFRAVREIEQLKPDVVHIFKPKGYAGAVACLLIRKGRVPVSIDCDDWEGWGGWNELKPYPYLVKEYIDRQERWLTRRADSVTVASRVLLSRALRMGQRRIFYAPNCVTRPQLELLGGIAAAEPAALKRELGLPESLLILYTGHFEPTDDVLFFCRAVLPALQAGAALAFVGDGEEMPKVRDLFAAHPGFAISYFGRLPYEEYLRVIGAADITCFPYPDTPVYRAKCSARIIDYMACGKPVVTTNTGQNPEYIVNGESGILVNPDDPQELSAALLELMGDAGRRHSLGSNARERISRYFVWDGEPIEQCEHAYHVALASRGSRMSRAPLASWAGRETSDAKVDQNIDPATRPDRLG